MGTRLSLQSREGDHHPPRHSQKLACMKRAYGPYCQFHQVKNGVSKRKGKRSGSV